MNEDTTKTPEPGTDKPAFWAVLPAEVRYDEDLPANAKLLYAEISSLTDRRGHCYASNEYFMRVFALSERTIQNLLNALKKGGYIRISDGNGGAGRRKIFAGLNPLLDNPAENCGVTPQKIAPDPAENCTQTSIKTKKETKPPKAPQGAESVPAWKPDRFAGLWDYYPRHTSKQAAAKAWEKLKPSDELIAEIGRALRRQKACDEWQRGVGIPYLSTYLNQRRWEDELGDFSPADDPAQGGRKDLVQL